VPQPSTKQLIREVVDKLPPEATVEEAMERLYLLAKIERGIAQADAGQTLSSEEVRARLGL
jgi:predicted transcriptional regulator